MRHLLIAAGLVSLAATGCATKPRPAPAIACATSRTISPEAVAIFAALQKLQPDPKGHQNRVLARSEDARGNKVVDMDVWPLSGPQDPAAAQKVRVVMRPCTYQLVKVGRLPG